MPEPYYAEIGERLWVETSDQSIGPDVYVLEDHREDYLVYPIRLQDRLPEIAIPLLPGNRDVVLDLQDVFQRSYDAGPYRRRIRYRDTESVPSLDPESFQWTVQLLHGMA